MLAIIQPSFRWSRRSKANRVGSPSSTLPSTRSKRKITFSSRRLPAPGNHSIRKPANGCFTARQLLNRSKHVLKRPRPDWRWNELHRDAAMAVSLEDNNRLFAEERERLEKWADDMVVAAEKDLSDTKAQIKAVRRQSRLATTLDEQNELQQKLRDLEKKQRKQRQQIFEIEDEIAQKRDSLIDGLQRRMIQKSHSTLLFTIQWEVV